MGPPETTAEGTSTRALPGRASDRVLTGLSRWKWLLPGLATGLVVYYAYVATHPYPAFGAGLFLFMSERVAHGPTGLPPHVPHYTDQGVPFAYPPLMFFLNGLLVIALDVDPIELARHLPHLASIAALVPFYLFAEDLLGSRREAGLATVLVSVSPPVLQWQVSAGGIVRGPAYLFTLAGLYTGLKLFRTGGDRWLVLSTVAFTLTVLTHPVYTFFFGLSYLWMYVSFDRTPEGLLRGAAVASGGVLVSSPWWLSVVAEHGTDVFTGAAGTHGGIGKRLPDLFALFVPGDGGAAKPVLFDVSPGLFDFTSFGMVVLTAWSVLFVGALGYLVVVEERTFLPGWVLLAVALVSMPRFTFLIGALMGGAAYYRAVVPLVEGRVAHPGRRTTARVGLALVVAVASLGTGVAYAGSHLDSHAGSESLPQFLDDDDVAAMSWAETNTPPDAEFVVLGDAAEWFPYETRRTNLVGPWGVEWRGEAAYDRQLGWFNHLSTCERASCLTGKLQEIGVTPDYVYVPKGEYSVRGMENTMSPEMRPTLVASPRYDLVYENEGVMIFAHRTAPEDPDPTDGTWNHVHEAWPERFDPSQAWPERFDPSRYDGTRAVLDQFDPSAVDATRHDRFGAAVARHGRVQAGVTRQGVLQAAARHVGGRAIVDRHVGGQAIADQNVGGQAIADRNVGGQAAAPRDGIRTAAPSGLVGALAHRHDGDWTAARHDLLRALAHRHVGVPAVAYRQVGMRADADRTDRERAGSHRLDRSGVALLESGDGGFARPRAPLAPGGVAELTAGGPPAPDAIPRLAGPSR